MVAVELLVQVVDQKVCHLLVAEVLAEAYVAQVLAERRAYKAHPPMTMAVEESEEAELVSQEPLAVEESEEPPARGGVLIQAGARAVNRDRHYR